MYTRKTWSDGKCSKQNSATDELRLPANHLGECSCNTNSFYGCRSIRVPTEPLQDLENDLALPEACRFFGLMPLFFGLACNILWQWTFFQPYDMATLLDLIHVPTSTCRFPSRNHTSCMIIEKPVWTKCLQIPLPGHRPSIDDGRVKPWESFKLLSS